ncbi:hypothetical protein [Streptomyces africanus]|uniref:hypothetical protein n=1 Tax=Streptomyces africanus TaxID=231024 RepID=UPI0027D8E751|nr:hypothetical protein [Streptomyces africanus]
MTAAAGLAGQPLLPVLVIRSSETTPGSQVSAGVLFALLAAAQAVALLWLARAPRAAYGVLLGLVLLWPPAMQAGGYTGPVLLPPLLSLIATCTALVVRAARGGADPTSGRFPSVLLAVPVHAAAATAAVLDCGTTLPAWAVGASATAGAALAAGTAHWYGTLRGRHDAAGRSAQDERLATWTEEAVREAWAERRRIATGLETTVLARTADMIAEAEAGHLDATADRAREALAAMRALLDTVREGDPAPDLRPQPTLQALDLLAHQCRATGRDVEIRLTDRVPERLPTAVDLAAYHAAETLLAAGGTRPALLELDADGDTLTLTATGVTAAAEPAVRRRLETRVKALDGTLTTGPGGSTLRLCLPLSAEEETER